ncbi:unnamed protein product [Paramecium sonneborni]|uniref:Uncharacterized protein n=1 Tax=Paramecium sonneborni TaxID=65129 RepID=A0A8S1R6Y1_9CILI|nr:unnamed protein product [Paramecium sonneborni]
MKNCSMKFLYLQEIKYSDYLYQGINNISLRNLVEKSIFAKQLLKKKGSQSFNIQQQNEPSIHQSQPIEKKRVLQASFPLIQLQKVLKTKQGQKDDRNVSSDIKPYKIRRLSCLKDNQPSQFLKFSLIITQQNRLKQSWDAIIFKLLIYVCLFTPYKITFIDYEEFRIASKR